ncbi:hypothetical protein L1049_013163 [Liquidambar formosana]|uniref:Uncharacterized protein n=1 Tax=Liquidambar formosana TaxID=63359 RepID=A0AAP0RMT3_LIQFO
MGSYKEERGAIVHGKPKMMIIMKTCMACLCSFLVSIAGGLMLVWWEVEFHPTNTQLWMVPFGLIMFGTPVIVWFSIFLSDLCNSDSDSPGLSRHDNSVHDPER